MVDGFLGDRSTPQRLTGKNNERVKTFLNKSHPHLRDIHC